MRTPETSSNRLLSRTPQVRESGEINQGIFSSRTKMLGLFTALTLGGARPLAQQFVPPLDLGILTLTQGIGAVGLLFLYFSVLRDLNPFKKLF